MRGARLAVLIVLHTALPAAAFAAGWAWTNDHFRHNRFAYPSEPFAAAVGAAMACWSIALATLVRHLTKPKNGAPR